MVSTEEKQRTRKIISLLRKAYPDAHCSLNFTNALELLIATILSAQCTDERVNIVTADLFRKYQIAILDRARPPVQPRAAGPDASSSAVPRGRSALCRGRWRGSR